MNNLLCLLLFSFSLLYSQPQKEELVYDYVPPVEEYVSETEWDIPLLRVTCYLPTGYKTASGQPTHLGGCAGRREDIGKIAAVYTIDKEFVGYFEINDCGSNPMLQNGYAIDIFRDNRDQAWDWVDTYGEYMYVDIIESEG